MKLSEIIDFEISTVLVEFKTKFNLQKFKSINGENIIELVKNKVNYAKQHLQLLGEGSSRVTFLLSNRFVLKIANPIEEEKTINRGIAQNEAEVELYKKTKSNLITRIYDNDPSFTWVISELVRPLDNIKEFEELSGITWKDYINILKIYKVLEGADIERAIKYFKNNIILFGKLISGGKIKDRVEEYRQKIEDYKRYLSLLQENDFIHSIIDLVKKHEVLAADLTSLNHWGKTLDGRVVLLDYGYTEGVWQKHYKDD